jgi:translation initiation factor 3 subunit I
MQVTDIQWAPDRSYFITSSKDKTAKLISAADLQVLKSYVADTPLNSAAITPVKDYVILGGGQAAMDVTTTSARQGKFEARFYHKIFEEEIGRVRGHFGPLNYVAVDPRGKSYASGGEDGYVRLHHFDRGYFEFAYEVEREEQQAHANGSLGMVGVSA